MSRNWTEMSEQVVGDGVGVVLVLSFHRTGKSATEGKVRPTTTNSVIMDLWVIFYFIRTYFRVMFTSDICRLKKCMYHSHSVFIFVFCIYFILQFYNHSLPLLCHKHCKMHQRIKLAL